MRIIDECETGNKNKLVTELIGFLSNNVKQQWAEEDAEIVNKIDKTNISNVDFYRKYEVLRAPRIQPRIIY